MQNKMYMNSPSGTQMDRYGVRFEDAGNGTTQPVVYLLSINAAGEAVWTEVVRSIANQYTEQEKQTVSQTILATFVKKHSRTRRKQVNIGDKVYHPKSKISGTITGFNGDMAVVDVNGFPFTLVKKELVLDRNA